MTIKELIENFESNYGRMLSPFELEDVRRLVNEEGYSPELVNEALIIAIRNGKYFINYVYGVLRRMRSRGIRTVKELKVSERQKELERQEDVKLDNDFIDAFIAAIKLWMDEPESEIQRLEELKKEVEK